MNVKHNKTFYKQLNHFINNIIRLFEIRAFVPMTYTELCSIAGMGKM